MPVILTVALAFWLIPPAALLWSGVTGLTAWVPAAWLGIALGVLFWMLICYGMSIPPLYGLGYPLGALVALYITWRSTWRGSRRVEWRGRVYSTDDG